jgi:hypothetical protein
MNLIGQIITAMIAYYAGDVRRINHFLQEIIEIAALTHDIGIKNSEEKYNSSAGNYQQIEGPPEAKKLLEGLDIESGVIDRVCWLIARHHTYTDIQGIDYQILVEADFLVNFYEDDMSIDSVHSAGGKMFKTLSGKAILNAIYA